MEEAFIDATYNGDLDFIRNYMAGGGDPSYTTTRQSDRPKGIFKGETGLHVSAANGKIDVMKLLLLEYGVDANSREVLFGATPLYGASHSGHTNAVQILLENGANPNLLDNDGGTAMMEASHRGYTDIVRLLLEYDANPNIIDNGGFTSLIEASKGGYIDVVRILLEHGADPNRHDKDGQTSLMWAAKGGHVDVVRMLLKHGVDPTTQRKDGQTSLMEASRDCHSDTSKGFIEHGVDPNMRRFDGRTSLMLASESGHIDVVRVLLMLGADHNMTDLLGSTAVSLAAPAVKSLVEDQIEREILWNRKKAMMMVLGENGYLQSVSVIATLSTSPLRFESVLGNEGLIRLIVSYI